jgi:hypothetical protein
MITREELVRHLAVVSHRSWIKQKVRDQGANEAELSTDVADHDLERAEDAVQELERLAIWPPSHGSGTDSNPVCAFQCHKVRPFSAWLSGSFVTGMPGMRVACRPRCIPRRQSSVGREDARPVDG